MFNARDVFVRRPECVSLWVLRARNVLALTAEEIAQGRPPTFLEANALEPAAQPESYYVFHKIGHKSLHQHVGEVKAISHAEAMQTALATFDHNNVTVWWVFPARLMKKSRPQDISDLFAIAETKIYRDQGQYHTVAALKKIKDQAEKERTRNAG